MIARAVSPLLVARPVWWVSLVWLHILVVGPIYAGSPPPPYWISISMSSDLWLIWSYVSIASIFAYVHGKEWIREPLLVGLAVHVTTLFAKTCEEAWGAIAAKDQVRQQHHRSC